MEFQADQAGTSLLISEIAHRPWSPISGFAGNSGIAHSTGFFYFVSWMSGGSRDPLVQVLSIALFNAFPIVLGLWFFRRNAVRFLAFAMMAVSPALVADSRKIWTPDLMAAWSTLSLFFFLKANEVRDGVKTQGRTDLGCLILFFLSGVSGVMGGHMYLPGVLVAGIATVLWSGWLWVRDRKCAWAWMAGCGLGWATFIPYIFKLVFQTCEVIQGHGSPRKFSSTQILYFLETFLFLPTPLAPYKLYVGKALDAMWIRFPHGWVGILVFFAGVGFLIWTPLYWLSVGLLCRSWKSARQDPVVFLVAFLVPGLLLGLGFLKLAAIHLNYWLGVLPYLYYLLSWGIYRQARRSYLIAAWAGVGCFLGFSGVFLILAHLAGGVPLIR